MPPNSAANSPADGTEFRCWPSRQISHKVLVSRDYSAIESDFRVSDANFSLPAAKKSGFYEVARRPFSRCTMSLDRDPSRRRSADADRSAGGSPCPRAIIDKMSMRKTRSSEPSPGPSRPTSLQPIDLEQPVMAEREGFEPSVPRKRDNGFRDRPVRPLRHLSLQAAAMT